MEQNLFSKYKNNYTKVRLELINDINISYHKSVKNG
jgi:hypothetical protein